VQRVPFRDHQMLGDGDAARLLDMAHLQSALLVTTEKDMARLSGSVGARAELASKSRALPVRMHIQAPDAERLWSFLDSACNARS
jgi:tetraacyldisaccharide 4'-kinase